MRIDVEDRGRRFADQTRAYAEYRLFAALSRVADGVREARVTLTALDHGDHADSTPVACTVTVTISGRSPLVVSVIGRHPAGAIDGAAGSVQELLRRRQPPPLEPVAAAVEACDGREGQGI